MILWKQRTKLLESVLVHVQLCEVVTCLPTPLPQLIFRQMKTDIEEENGLDENIYEKKKNKKKKKAYNIPHQAPIASTANLSLPYTSIGSTPKCYML